MSIREVLPISEKHWRIDAAPAWLDRWEPDWDFGPPEASPVALLLVDEQHHAASQSISNRIVRRLLNPAALQTFAQVEFPFDATTHSLQIHDLVIWRQDPNGTWQGNSVIDEVPFFLDEHAQSSGRISVVAQLDDLRVGDAIDLSWTIEPLDPLLDLPFSAFHGFVWNVPCGVTHFTVYPDPAFPLRSQLHCPKGISPPEEDSDPTRQHWRQSRPPITRFEPSTPPGVWNFPVLEVSGWRDWSEVAEAIHALWADALSDDASGALADAALALSAGQHREEAISEIIRFVQDDIEFLDASSGRTFALAPRGAETVLGQRRGDAKDKAVLLTALLRRLGIDAAPTLVNPDWQDTVASLLPSPSVFNHVIVAFTVDGLRHFVDPSEASQRGSYPAWAPPSYGFGLEVQPGVTALVSLPPVPAAELTLRETFHLAPAGADGTVEQVLRATNWLAEEMRESIARDGTAAFIQAHIDALRHPFPALVFDSQSVGLREDPDPATDAIELRGRFGLPTWGSLDEPPPTEFRHRANGIFLAVDWIEQPEERTVARALRHPMRVQHQVAVHAPFIQPAAPEQRALNGPGFRYRREVTWQEGLVTYEHVWESTAAQVDASQWPVYCRGLQDVFEQLDSRVSTQPSKAPRPSPKSPSFPVRKALFFLLIAIGLAGTWAGIAHLTKARPALAEAPVAPPEPPALPAPAPVTAAEPSPPPAIEPLPSAPEVLMAVDAATQGDLTSAEALLEQRQEDHQENPTFQYLRAEVAIRLGQLDRAREALARAKALDPTNVNAEILTALLQRAEGDRSSAGQVLAAAVERNPNDPRPLRELAITLAQQGDVKGAQDAWERVLMLAPEDTDALRQYAVLLWQNGERERADTLITRALSGPEATASLEAAAGDYYTLTGRPEQAMSRLEKAASLDPEDRTRDFALASGHLRTGRAAEAAELSAKLAQEFPTDVRAWRTLAVAKSIVGDAAGAEAAYHEWMRLAPHDPNGPANFGYFLHQTGRAQEARDLLAKSTEQFPNEGMIWLNYSAVLESLGETEPAAAARLKATELLTPEEKQLMVR